MKFDELRKLGDRIEGLLKQLLNDTVHVDKNRLSERRATQIKLTRDFRKMEVMHKNLEMDFRQRVGRMSSSNNSSSYSTLSSERQVPDQRDAVQLQLRLEEEVSAFQMRASIQVRYTFLTLLQYLYVALELIVFEQTAEAEQIMRDRETEVREINRKMHQVNAIYKVSFTLYECKRLRLRAAYSLAAGSIILLSTCLI